MFNFKNFYELILKYLAKKQDSEVQVQEDAKTKARKAFEAAQKNLMRAPAQLASAEETWVKLDKGPAFYNKLISDRRLTKFNKNYFMYLNAHQAEMKELVTFMKQYKTDKLYNDQVEALFETRAEQVAQLEKELHEVDNTAQTESRRVVYEDADRESLVRFRTAILVLYYALLVAALLFGSLFQYYRSKKMWFLVVVYVLLPIGINLTVRGLFWLQEQLVRIFVALPYKNAYQYK